MLRCCLHLRSVVLQIIILLIVFTRFYHLINISIILHSTLSILGFAHLRIRVQFELFIPALVITFLPSVSELRFSGWFKLSVESDYRCMVFREPFYGIPSDQLMAGELSKKFYFS